MDSIKVLVISHNPFSTYQSMGKTFVSLFAGFDKHELCQLYIFPSYPNIDQVNSYYRITDREAVRAVFCKKQVGQKVSVHEYSGCMIESDFEKKIYSKRSNNSPLKRLLRDFVWKASNWYSDRLKEWLDNESPTCIFLAPGYAKFIYDIALKISKDRKIPIVWYICDDYYFVKKPETFIGRYQLKALQKKIRKTMQKTNMIISISEEIKKKYSDEFSVSAEVIMTGASLNGFNAVSGKSEIKGFSYFGNIGINRERPLSDIGRVLDEINNESNRNYCLNIYTNTDNGIIGSAFKNINSIKMHDFLVGDAFVEEFLNADCLVHVEDFSQESIDIVKGSISTKIADSLSSGIPLLAYGPEDIASIEHLKRNECAFLANSKETLKMVVCELLEDENKRNQIVENALATAKRYHCTEVNSSRLKSIIEQL